MDQDQIRAHLSAISEPWAPQQQRVLSESIVATCWPSGSQDRLERSALEWLRRWRPVRAVGVAPPLPACSCATGHCTVCN